MIVTGFGGSGNLVRKVRCLSKMKPRKIRSHPRRYLLKYVSKVKNARVKVEWVKRDELNAICMKVLVKGKGRDLSTEKGSVHDEE